MNELNFTLQEYTAKAVTVTAEQCRDMCIAAEYQGLWLIYAVIILNAMTYFMMDPEERVKYRYSIIIMSVLCACFIMIAIRGI